MPKLTPTEQATLDAVRQGPGNVHELTERTGRSRSGTDRALAALAKAGLITKADTGGDPADGTLTRWQLADPTPATDEPAGTAQDGPTTVDLSPQDNLSPQEEAQPDDEATGAHDAAAHPATDGPDTEQPHDADTDVDPVPDGQRPDDSSPERQDGEDPSAAQTDGGQPEQADPQTQPEDEQATPGAATQDDTAKPGDADKPDGDGQTPAQPEHPKLCRGCQAQMPKVCPCCWQKTPAYCGKCRKDMPQVRRGEPGEPGEPPILSNGLPKLRPGELEELVLKVMQGHPVPNHVGVTGWTGSRVAVFLPGRSTGAINNALEKLVRTGKAELIGDKPMRFKLPEPATPPGTEADDAGAGSGGADTKPDGAGSDVEPNDHTTSRDVADDVDQHPGSDVSGTPADADDAAPTEAAA